MIYLATPYFHKDPSIRQKRYEKAMHIVYWHLRNGIYIYSPILYCHPMSLEYKLPGDASFWEQFDHAFIYPASSVWFYLGEGWKTSEGMRREYEKALEWTKPIYTVESLGCCYAHNQISYQLYKND